MNNHYYKTFISLAETLNFSVTARQLHIAQSTVSNRIKELEVEFASCFFERTNKSVSLTLAGEKFLQYAQRMVRIQEDFENELKSMKHDELLKIGTPHGVYKGILEENIKKLLMERSTLSIKITINHTQQLIRWLEDGLIDIAILAYLPASLSVEKLLSFEDEVRLYTKNAPTFKDEVDHYNLAQMPMLHSDLGQAFDYWLKEKTIDSLEYSLEIDQINEVISYVEEGFGYAFIPESLAKGAVDQKRLKKVRVTGLETYKMCHYLVTKKTTTKSRLIKEFMDQLK